MRIRFGYAIINPSLSLNNSFPRAREDIQCIRVVSSVHQDESLVGDTTVQCYKIDISGGSLRMLNRNAFLSAKLEDVLSMKSVL